MTARAGVPAGLLTPTAVEVDAARARIGHLAADSYVGTYGAFGAVASGSAGEIVRALRQGDLEAAARGLRILAAADLAACEIRDQLTEQTATAVDGEPDLALGGLDEVVTRALAVAGDPARTPLERARAAGHAEGIQRTTYVLTGRQIWTESTR